MQSNVEFNTDEQRLRPKDSVVFLLWGDKTHLRELNGGQPEYTLQKDLKETVDCFSKPENLKKYKTGIYNLENKFNLNCFMKATSEIPTTPQ